jgi:hypothetical protein
VCPECGQAVVRSLAVGSLRYASGAYLRCLTWGAGLVMAGVWGVGLLQLAEFLAVVGTPGYVKRLATANWWTVADIGVRWAAIVIGLLLLTGVWLLSVSPPNTARHVPGVGLARIVRWLLVGGLLLLVGMSMLWGAWSWLPVASWWLVQGWVAVLVLLVHLLVLRLLQRADARDTAALAQFVVLFHVLLVLTRGGALPGGGFLLLQCIVLIIVPVYLVVTAVLYGRAASVFSRVRRLAQNERHAAKVE